MSTLTAPTVQPRWQGVIQQYAPYLPVTEATPIISLNEGNTPLIAASNFVESIGGKFDLYLKFEGLNHALESSLLCGCYFPGVAHVSRRTGGAKGRGGDEQYYAELGG